MYLCVGKCYGADTLVYLVDIYLTDQDTKIVILEEPYV